MKPLFLIFALLFSAFIFSQTSFEKGYFIKTNGEKVDCFIKNYDLENSPEDIDYKMSIDESVPASIKALFIQELGIYGVCKYQRIDTQIDYSRNKDIQLQQKSLLAQVIVEGKATLYSYQDVENKQYFYKVDNSIVQQLIYKEFIENNRYIYNNDYLIKLNGEVKCIVSSEYVKVRFNENSLKKYFIDFNNCKSSEITFNKPYKKTNLKVNLVAGINNSGLDVVFNSDFGLLDESLNYKSKISPVVGIELEANVPKNKYKYSFTTGLYYRSFNSEAENITTGDFFEMDYSTVEFNLGFRHYFFLNEDHRIFAEVNGVFDLFYIKDEAGLNQSELGLIDYYFRSVPNASFGLGYQYKKIGILLKYFTNRDLFRHKAETTTKFKNVSLVIRYNIL